MASIFPNKGTLRRLIESQSGNPILMLNLLQFREFADYSASPELSENASISGSQAYERYMKHAMPFIEAVGGERRLFSHASESLIGPLEEQWDAVLQVWYPHAEAFQSFATDPNYLAGVGHRTAAIQDSRLIPIIL